MIDLDDIRGELFERLTFERYSHTLGVENTALSLAEILCPESVLNVQAAALLHDVAKEIPYEEQIKLIEEFGLIVTDEDLTVAPGLHAICGVAIIMRDFLFCANKDVLSAVYKHCVGDSRMSLIDKIIYISDYIEPSRTFDAAIELRQELLCDLSQISKTDLLKKLDCAVLSAATATVENLRKNNRHVHSRTLRMIEVFEGL